MTTFLVTVQKTYEQDVPVQAETRQQAEKLIQKLIDKKDVKFIFGGLDETAADYEIQRIFTPSGEYLKTVAAECETVRSDGSHDWG